MARMGFWGAGQPCVAPRLVFQTARVPNMERKGGSLSVSLPRSTQACRAVMANHLGNYRPSAYMDTSLNPGSLGIPWSAPGSPSTSASSS